jgi:putative heme transporter
MNARVSVGRLAGGLLAALVATVVVVSAIGRIAGFSEVRATLEGAEPSWLVLCAVGQIAVFAGYAGAIRRTLESGADGMSIGVGDSFRLALAGFAATQVFAFGGVAGLALLYWALRRFGRDRRQAMIELIGMNTAVYLFFGVVAWGGSAVALATSAAPVAMTVPWLVGIPTLVLVARWFTAPSRIERWTNPDHDGARRLLGVGISAASWTRARTVDERPLFAWACLYWAGDVLSLSAALRAFDADPAIAAVVVAYATGYLVQALPIPLIATAGVDAATVATLHAVGVPLDAALLGVLAHRLFAFWLPVIPGAVFALTLLGLAPPEDATQRSGVSDRAESS